MIPSDTNTRPDAGSGNTSGTAGGREPEAFNWQSWLNERLPRVRSDVEQIMAERQP